MNNVTKKFDIDLYSPTIYEIIQAQQGDNNSRIIEFVLYNQGKPYTISNNISVKMEGHRGDNSSFQPKNCTVSGNVISCILDSDILYEAGTVEAKIVMYDLSSDTILSTIPFKISVQKNPCDKNKIEKEKKSLIDWLILNFEKLKASFEEHLKDFLALNSTLTEHITDNIRHITSTERTNWDDSYTKRHIHSNKGTLDNITASYTIEEKDKLNNIQAGAEVNIQADWNEADTASDSFIKNKPSVYTKNEVDNKFSALETNIDWKESVDTFDDIAFTYQYPQDGWTVNVNDTDYTYRYNGTSWVAISANAIPKATQSVDGLLTREDKINYDDANSKKHIHNNKSIIDKITQVLLDNWNTAYTHISDTVKHITSSERTLWNTVSNKVDKVEGKGLSTNDFTTEEKNMLASISSGSVTGVKGNAESQYRKGNVNITPENIGLAAGNQLTLLNSGTFKLRDSCTYITDWNDAITNGWYFAMPDALNSPSTDCWYYGLIITQSTEWLRQIVYGYGKTGDVISAYSGRYERIKHNGTWGEWINTSVHKSVPSDAVFTDSKVKQTPYDMSDTTHYELNVLFSKSKNNSEKTEETYIAEGFTYSPYMGSLNVHRIIADYFTQWDYRFSDKMKIGTSAMSFSDIKKTIVCVDGNAHSKVGKYLDFIGDNGDSVSVNSNITFAVGTNDDHANDTFLYIQMPTRSTGNSTGFVFRKNTDPAIDSSSFYSDPIIKTNGSITRPYLGMNGTPWNSLFTVTSPIITSDRNKKHDISYLCDNKDGIGDKFERFFLKLKAAIFRYNENTSNRLHMGGISQDVEAAMQELGIDSTEFAGFCKDVRYTYTEFDENGMGLEDSKVAETDADGNILYDYSLRYEEFIFLCIHMVQKLWDKNKSLEEKVSVLDEENDTKIKQLEKRIEDLEKLISGK